MAIWALMLQFYRFVKKLLLSLQNTHILTAQTPLSWNCTTFIKRTFFGTPCMYLNYVARSWGVYELFKHILKCCRSSCCSGRDTNSAGRRGMFGRRGVSSWRWGGVLIFTLFDISDVLLNYFVIVESNLICTLIIQV